MDVEFDENDRLIYKGVKFETTKEQIYHLQDYGVDAMNYIEEMYKKSTIYIRDQKIDLILKK